MSSGDAILRALNNLKRSANPDTALNTSNQSYGQLENKIPNYGRGNINLSKRPVYKNPDGTISTVRSVSFTDDNGNALLIPTIRFGSDGITPVSMTPLEALDWYNKTGEYLGKFKNEQDATTYAIALHNSQAKMYK